MSNGETKIGGSPRSFPATDWSALLQLRDPRHPEFKQHLENMIRRYWKPVYHYFRSLRATNHVDAEDLTQQFFMRLLENRALQRVSPERGSFRGYLKTCIKNFSTSEWRSKSRRRPRRGALLLPFDEALHDWEALIDKRTDLSAEQVFDREWARVVMLDAVDQPRERLAEEGKTEYFDLFEQYCIKPGDASRGSVGREDSPAEETADMTYRTLADRRGMQEHDVRNRLRYVRKRIREIIRQRIAGYARPGRTVEDELRFILSQ